MSKIIFYLTFPIECYWTVLNPCLIDYSLRLDQRNNRNKQTVGLDSIKPVSGCQSLTKHRRIQLRLKGGAVALSFYDKLRGGPTSAVGENNFR